MLQVTVESWGFQSYEGLDVYFRSLWAMKVEAGGYSETLLNTSMLDSI
jgi:hypothetical protein